MSFQRPEGAVHVQLNWKKGRPRYRTLIDAEDYERVTRLSWSPKRAGLSIYAYATSLYGIPKHHQRLHAFIIKAEPGQIVDHINGDTLDNRKANLRIVTAAENARNARRATSVGKSSKFKGVSLDKRSGRWLASIRSNGTMKRLGLFDAETEAAMAYDTAAKQMFGEFARTNADMRLYDIAGKSALELVPHSSSNTKVPRRSKRRERIYGPYPADASPRPRHYGEITPAIATAMLAGLPPIVD